jgi:GDP-L-fucose synthase
VDYDFNKIEFDTSKYVGAKSKCLTIDKMKKIYPEFNFRDLKNGIEQTLSWMIENKSSILSEA